MTIIVNNAPALVARTTLAQLPPDVARGVLNSESGFAELCRAARETLAHQLRGALEELRNELVRDYQTTMKEEDDDA